MLRTGDKVEPAVHLSMRLSFLMTVVVCDPLTKCRFILVVRDRTVCGLLLAIALLSSSLAQKGIKYAVHLLCVLDEGNFVAVCCCSYLEEQRGFA